jgi:SAM-dependent methyltransferase
VVQTRKLAGWKYYDHHVEVCDVVRGREIETLESDDRKVAEWFIQALAGRRRVIDIGCGSGFPGLYVAAHVDEVVGVDAAPNVVHAARAHAGRLQIPNARFQVGQADKVRFDDNSFDGAMACGALECMDWEEARRALAQIWRVLRQDGRLAVLDQDWELVLRDKPHRLGVIRGGEGPLTVQFVERSAAQSTERTWSPPMERDERYTIVPQSPTGQRLLAALGDERGVRTDLTRENLAPEDIVELVYEENAQFDRETLAAFVASAGFREVKVEQLAVWNPHPLVLTAIK